MLLNNKNFEFLLNRDIINFNIKIQNQFTEIYKNKTILVTGGAGSIGSNLVLNLLKLQPKNILIVDNNEISLVNFKKKIQSKKCLFYLSDVSRIYILERLFKKFKIDFLFHTAAYKHVDILEDNVTTGIINNINSTFHICKICKKYNVTLVNVSTDKAVKPISVLGYTKKISELIVISFVKKFKNLKFYNVRFGNVFNSGGSAIEQFIKQIRLNKKITLTDQRMKRFFMTNDEASYLIMSPPLIGGTDSTFIYDMGEQVKIYDLIKKIFLKSKKKFTKNNLILIGRRKGEKLNEVLSDNKNLKKTNLKRVLIIDEKKFHFNKVFYSKIVKLIFNKSICSINKEFLKTFLRNI